MSEIFSEIEAFNKKKAEKEIKERIENINKIADEIVELIKAKDLSFEDGRYLLDTVGKKISAKLNGVKITPFL
jgi:methyl-accepting chemotaxis protein